MNKKRVAIIGMSGDSLFYDISGNNKKLVHREVGGKGYNQAIACIRNGVNVSYLTAVGDDEVGKMLEDFMQKEGIDTFFSKKNKPSLAAQILVDSEGNNTVLYDRNNVSELDSNDVYEFESEIMRSDCLLLQYEYKEEVIKTAIKIAKKYGKLVVVNPAPMIYPDINLINGTDIITPNEEEAYKLFGLYRKKSFDYIVKEEQKSDFKMVLNTLGSAGVMLVSKENVIEYKPIKVNAVDTTGAGDTFNGIFVSEYLKTNDIQNSIKRAVIGSGLSVTKKYVMDAIPFEKDIDEYIEKLN